MECVDIINKYLQYDFTNIERESYGRLGLPLAVRLEEYS